MLIKQVVCHPCSIWAFNAGTFLWTTIPSNRVHSSKFYEGCCGNKYQNVNFMTFFVDFDASLNPDYAVDNVTRVKKMCFLPQDGFVWG